MKAIVLAAVFGIAIMAGCNQNGGKPSENTAAMHPAAPLKSVNYKCPECGYGANVAGDCPKDKISLVKVGYYYCPECYMSDSLQGKCKMCGVKTKKMD